MYMDGFIHLGIGIRPCLNIHVQILQTDPPVFSLNFSSAGKGPVIAVEAKNIHQRCTFLGAGG